MAYHGLSWLITFITAPARDLQLQTIACRFTTQKKNPSDSRSSICKPNLSVSLPPTPWPITWKDCKFFGGGSNPFPYFHISQLFPQPIQMKSTEITPKNRWSVSLSNIKKHLNCIELYCAGSIWCKETTIAIRIIANMVQPSSTEKLRCI